MTSCIIRVGLLFACLLAAGGAGRTQEAFSGEVRFGILDHDTSAVGSTSHERGIAFNGELLFAPRQLFVLNAVSLHPVVFDAHAVLGVEIAPENPGTDFLYGGLTLTATYRDWLFAGLFVGLAVHDGNADFDHKLALSRGHISGAGDIQKFLGSRVLFREALEIGVRFGPEKRSSVSAFVAHYSHGEILSSDTRNSGMDQIGFRYGRKF